MKANIFKFLLLGLGCLITAEPGSKSIQGEYESTISGHRVSGNFEFHVEDEADGYKFIQKNNAFESESLFGDNLEFKSITRKLTNKADYSQSNSDETFEEDYYFAQLSENKKVLYIHYELDGKKVKTKKVKIKGDFKVFNNLYLTLQRDLQKGVENFKSFIVFPESASGYKASFDFYKTSDVLSKASNYNVPDFFSKGIQSGKEVVVCEIGLLGMAGIFFPHKFNFVFNSGGDYEFLGYWGGNPESPNYYIADTKTGDM